MRKRIDELFVKHCKEDRTINFHIIDKQKDDDLIKLEQLKQTDNDNIVNIIFVT